MRKLFLVFLLPFVPLATRPANANDSAVSGVGGRWQMQRAEHRTVSMERENVAIAVRPDASYAVTADFVFRNYGAATQVMMGFPESWGGDRGPFATTSYQNFRTWVDGRRVAARRAKVKEKYNEGTALWLKTVSFGAGQVRRIRVSYLSSGGGMSTGEHWVDYGFTGGNWRGEVRESVLTVQFPPGRYAVRPYDDLPDQPNPEITRRGGFFRYRWRNWQAQRDFRLEFKTLVPGGLYMDNQPTRFQKAILVNQPGLLRGYHHGWGSSDRPDAILHHGRMWLSLSFLASQRGSSGPGAIPAMVKKTWNGAKHTLFLWSGRRYLPIKIQETAPYGSLSLQRPDRTFYLANGGAPEFYIPAKALRERLGIAFRPPGADDDPYELRFDP